MWIFKVTVIGKEKLSVHNIELEYIYYGCATNVATAERKALRVARDDMYRPKVKEIKRLDRQAF